MGSGWVFEGVRAIHRETGKPVFGQLVPAGPPSTMGHREDVAPRALLGSSLPATPGSYQTTVACGDSSLPGAGPLSKSF